VIQLENIIENSYNKWRSIPKNHKRHSDISTKPLKKNEKRINSVGSFEEWNKKRALYTKEYDSRLRSAVLEILVENVLGVVLVMKEHFK